MVPGAKTSLYDLYQIPVLRSVTNTGTAKIPALIFAMLKKITPQKFISSENQNDKEESRTTFRNNSKGFERCKQLCQTCGFRCLSVCFVYLGFLRFYCVAMI